MFYLFLKYSYCKDGRIFTETYEGLDEKLIKKIITRYENYLHDGTFYTLSIELSSND